MVKHFKSPEKTYKLVGSHIVNMTDEKDPWFLGLDKIIELGFGAIVLHMPQTDSYLVNEDEWKKMEDVLKRIKKTGMDVILYDEKGFPSGDAGGLVLKKDNGYEALGLYQMGMDAEKGRPARLNIPDRHPVYLKAIPYREGKIYLEGAIDIDVKPPGELIWEPQDDSKYHVMAFFEAPLFENTFAGSGWVKKARRYINIMDKKE